MFGLFKKSFLQSGLFNGFADIHCHILPGVDDGIQKMENAVRTLNYYEENGAKRVFFTPHIAEELHENTRDNLYERFEQLRKEYKGNMELSLGAEYMLDNGFEKLIDKKEDFLCASGKHILVETVAQQPPINMSQILFELQDRGYEVILAHPERYFYMHDKEYDELVGKHISLQLNLCSLTGLYGGHAKEKGKRLLEKGMYTFLGTDLHKLSCHKEQFEMKVLSKSDISQLAKLIENNNNLPLGQ